MEAIYPKKTVAFNSNQLRHAVESKIIETDKNNSPGKLFLRSNVYDKYVI